MSTLRVCVHKEKAESNFSITSVGVISHCNSEQLELNGSSLGAESVFKLRFCAFIRGILAPQYEGAARKAAT